MLHAHALEHILLRHRNRIYALGHIQQPVHLRHCPRPRTRHQRLRVQLNRLRGLRGQSPERRWQSRGLLEGSRRSSVHGGDGGRVARCGSCVELAEGVGGRGESASPFELVEVEGVAAQDAVGGRQGFVDGDVAVVIGLNQDAGQDLARPLRTWGEKEKERTRLGFRVCWKCRWKRRLVV